MFSDHVDSSSQWTTQQPPPQDAATDRRRRLAERGLALFLWQATAWRMRAVGRRIVRPSPRREIGKPSASGTARPATTLLRVISSTVRAATRAVLRPLRALVHTLGTWRRRLFLSSHRENAKVFWPGLTGLDLWIVAFWLALLRFHKPMLWAVCAPAAWLRRVRPPIPGRPNHVLHVTASFDIGGTQTQIKNLCQTDSPVASHDVIEIFPEHNYLYRREVRVDPSRYTGSGRIGRLVGHLIAHTGTRSSQIIQIIKLVKDFRAARPEVVVGWGHEISMITFVAAAIARVPHIVFCIRTFNPTLGWAGPEMSRLLYATHKRMVPYLSRLIVNSTPLQRDYAAWLGIDERKITVCANGIDAPVPSSADTATRASIRARYGIAEDALVLVHVGRFSAEKGQSSLMRANVELLRRYPNRRFVWLLCGDGLTMPDVRKYAEEHGFANVVFAGRVTDVHAHLLAADIFVMPSDFEGMPNAMMEAMALGLPAVSTDRSGAVDVARDTIEALYYSPGDVPRLIEHLMFLFEDDDARRAMGVRARARMNQFSVSRAAETFNASITGLLTRREMASS
jgi:glycosyltransferase involved in cell wall biosynthesis